VVELFPHDEGLVELFPYEEGLAELFPYEGKLTLTHKHILHPRGGTTGLAGRLEQF